MGFSFFFTSRAAARFLDGIGRPGVSTAALLLTAARCGRLLRRFPLEIYLIFCSFCSVLSHDLLFLFSVDPFIWFGLLNFWGIIYRTFRNRPFCIPAFGLVPRFHFDYSEPSFVFGLHLQAKIFAVALQWRRPCGLC